MNNLTVIILTYNEENHISRCIESVREFVDDIVVVDSYSNDETINIAVNHGARVFQNIWKNHAAQFNWALENTLISSEWVMRLDADEYVEDCESLITELARQPSGITGVYILRKYFFMGQWMRHGGMHPISNLRIWRKGCAKIEDRWMDEHAVLTKGSAIHNKLSIVDSNENGMTTWIEKHNHYATREMIEILNLEYLFTSIDRSITKGGDKQAGRKRLVKENIYSKLPIFLRPTLYFLYRYILRLGFLDGKKGFAFHFMQAYWYRVLVDLKVLEARSWIRNENDPEVVKSILRKETGLKI